MNASALARSRTPPQLSTSAPRRDDPGRRSTNNHRRSLAMRTRAVHREDASASDAPRGSDAATSRRAALASIALAASIGAPYTSRPPPARALVDDANARKVFEQARRSVVGLADYTPGGANGGYVPRGTGVVWANLPAGDAGVGYVVTNFHVVAPDHLPSNENKQGVRGGSNAASQNSSTRLRVAVADAKSGEPVWYEASVVGTQRSSDLAVLRVQLADGEGKDGGLVPVKVGTSKDLKVGQTCYALGAGDAGVSNLKGTNTTASFRQQATMSAGVVSGLRRSVPSKNATTIRGAIQTDAKVPENASGGALLDSGGRLVGLTVTPYGKGQAGVGFAVAVDDLINIVPSLITLHQIS